jgi:hypothetical protein
MGQPTPLWASNVAQPTAQQVATEDKSKDSCPIVIWNVRMLNPTHESRHDRGGVARDLVQLQNVSRV